MLHSMPKGLSNLPPMNFSLINGFRFMQSTAVGLTVITEYVYETLDNNSLKIIQIQKFNYLGVQ